MRLTGLSRKGEWLVKSYHHEGRVLRNEGGGEGCWICQGCCGGGREESAED